MSPSTFVTLYNHGSPTVHLLFSPLVCRCENYTISLLEQCENLEEVETLLQTKTQYNQTRYNNANYFMAILGKGAESGS